jgi:hypothetical protein
MVMGDEVVSVALWRGYVTGRFYARSADRNVALALSPSFRIVRWPWESRVSLSRNQDAVDALDELQQGLIKAGWERSSAKAGSRWYQLSFRQPLRGGSLTPRPHKANGTRIHVAERAAPAVEERPSNGHAAGAVAGAIVAALESGPLASSELSRRVGRPSGVVRMARRELEVAGLVQKAAPPPGGSKRATYWTLSARPRAASR